MMPDDGLCHGRTGTVANHCWHSTCTVLTSCPPQDVQVCCYCGTTRNVYLGQLENPPGHGPYMPSRVTMVAVDENTPLSHTDGRDTMPTHDQLYEAALSAISRLHGDTTVSQEQTVQSLLGVREELTIFIQSVEDDIARAADSPTQ